MTRVSVIYKRAVEYANLVNNRVAEDAIITGFHREEGHFDSISHNHYKMNGVRIHAGCGCEYCTVLYAYAKARINLHRLKKNLYNDLSIYYISTEDLLERIVTREQQCLALRRRLVKSVEEMRVPNAVKRKAKYEKS